jgi:predicted RNA-binding Zn ribbon-like protein
MAFSGIIGSDQLSQLRLRAADDCDNVYVDLSKNRCRRFCTTSCAYRTHAAADRRRQAAKQKWPQP